MPAAPNVRELGVPVKSVNWVRLMPGQDAQGRPALYATMGQNAAPMFILQIDPQAGRWTQHSSGVPEAMYPTAAKWAPRGKCLYVGSCHAGHLHRFDPRKGVFEDLGAIDPNGCEFPCRIDEAPNGAIWIGFYGTCGLTRFDPASGEFTRFGRMDETDMYFYPLAGDDGSVAGMVKVTRPHVVAINPATGEHCAVGPVADTNTRTGSVNLIKGVDGRLYIVATEGNFRIDGTSAVPVAAVPEAQGDVPGALPDGSTFRFADADAFEHHQLEIIKGGDRRRFPLDWQGAGTHVFSLHHGPDGKIYGSSVLPEHLFRYDPATGEMGDLGQCSTSAGEAYSMGNLGGLLYIASYPAAQLSVYDPAKPYRFGTDENANPREVGRMDEVSYRPVAMLTGPLGRVWTGSYPDYGMWGGPLSWYDPATHQRGTCRHVLPDHSVCCLAWIESLGLIAGGTSVQAGSGTLAKAQRAALFLWDSVRNERVWDSDFGMDLKAVMDLLAFTGPLAYAVVSRREDGGQCELMLIDLDAKRIVSRNVLSSRDRRNDPIALSLRRTADGRIFGATGTSLFEIAPRTTDVRTVADGLNISVPGPIADGKFYYAHEHVLCELTVPD